MIIVYLGPDTQGISFVTSKFAVVSFLSDLEDPLRAHSLQFTVLKGQPLLN